MQPGQDQHAGVARFFDFARQTVDADAELAARDALQRRMAVERVARRGERDDQHDEHARPEGRGRNAERQAAEAGGDSAYEILEALQHLPLRSWTA